MKRLTLRGAWRISPKWRECGPWRHRERVRFGAWEGRPRASASPLSRRNLMAHLVCAYACTHGIAVEPWQVQERLWRMGANLPRRNSAGTMARILATEMSGAQTGTGEGPRISGPENTYKCEPVAYVIAFDDRTPPSLVFQGVTDLRAARSWADPGERVWGLVPVEVAEVLIDKGGHVEPRTPIANASTSPMRVLTERQWRAIEHKIEGER